MLKSNFISEGGSATVGTLPKFQSQESLTATRTTASRATETRKNETSTVNQMENELQLIPSFGDFLIATVSGLFGKRKYKKNAHH